MGIIAATGYYQLTLTTPLRCLVSSVVGLGEKRSRWVREIVEGFLEEV